MTTDKSTKLTSSRIQSIDILRGLVMVLMAIDHVRVYSGISASSPEFGVFFTRWITHFCAPAFTFFAGTSIFLMGMKIKSKAKLAKQLVTRGLILIVLELFLLHFFWTFNFNFFDYILAGVIWMLGCCMLLMAAFIWLKPKLIGVMGLVIIIGQQLFTYVPRLVPEGMLESFLQFWKFIYPTGFENPQTDTVVVLYVLVPWIGVMAIGYAFGELFNMEKDRRKKICVRLGSIITGLFLVIAIGQYFMLESSDSARPFLFEILGQRKYPASQMFLMMTLGPLILAVPFLETTKGRLVNALSTIGSVPLFYYVLHILLIHASALLVYFIIDGSVHNEWFDYAPFVFVPEISIWSLPTLYAVLIVDVVLLYMLCRWYASYKRSQPDKKWLKYL